MDNRPYKYIGIVLAALIFLSLASCSDDDAKANAIIASQQDSLFRAQTIKTKQIIPLRIPRNKRNVYQKGDTLQALKSVEADVYIVETSTKPVDEVTFIGDRKRERVRVILQ